MMYFYLYILIILISLPTIGFLSSKRKGYVAIISVILISIVSSIPSVLALSGNNTILIFSGSLITDKISIVIDPLAAWFILVINFSFITGAIYGSSYMRVYDNLKSKLSLHWISYILAHSALIAVCSVQNNFAFLIAWEIMALATFVLVIFEGNKIQTIKAGINYLIQSHIAILMLTIAFIWVYAVTDSFSFNAISLFAKSQSHLASFILMLLFFIGFGIKAGFVPFHTWLPLAHPAAPTHISAVMSGVIIKIGIYGILRMIFLLDVNYLAVGYFILIVSVFTGIYGVMLAIIQHNLKKLLAYHSIENIGIIGIGIGVGCLGMAYDKTLISILGFSGALMHTLNHSLFKSLLFYGAGNIYQATHSMNIERFGGLIKKMPHTAFLFLIAALAICGLPPFNGFVSEFLIYIGLIGGLEQTDFAYILPSVFAILGLALIGGLAMLCFTKAFGIVFLGSPRVKFEHEVKESNKAKIIPMYFVVSLIVIIGVFPKMFIQSLSSIATQLTGYSSIFKVSHFTSVIDKTEVIGRVSIAVILLSALIYYIRNKISNKQQTTTGETWGCGYVAPSEKMQYTASSYVKSYSELANPMLSIKKTKKNIEQIFPNELKHETHPNDKIENLIHSLIQRIRYFLDKFLFLQNGKLQSYILYGMIFIMALIGIPLMYYLYEFFIQFLNKL